MGLCTTKEKNLDLSLRRQRPILTTSILLVLQRSIIYVMCEFLLSVSLRGAARRRSNLFSIKDCFASLAMTRNLHTTLLKNFSWQYFDINIYFHSIRCHGLCPWIDAVLARGHATGKWRPEGSSLDKRVVKTVLNNPQDIADSELRMSEPRFGPFPA